MSDSKTVINDAPLEILESSVKKLREDISNDLDARKQNAEEIKPTQIKKMLKTHFDNFEKEITELVKKLIADKEQLWTMRLETLADVENTKKRLREEQVDIRKYRASHIAEELLPALDNFERALQVKNGSAEVKNFLLGFEMVFKSIKDALKLEGVEEINIKPGDKFDHNLAEAIELEYVPDMEPNIIIGVMQKGYLIHERVLRHAKVKVSKAK